MGAHDHIPWLPSRACRLGVLTQLWRPEEGILGPHTPFLPLSLLRLQCPHFLVASLWTLLPHSMMTPVTRLGHSCHFLTYFQIKSCSQVSGGRCRCLLQDVIQSVGLEKLASLSGVGLWYSLDISLADSCPLSFLPQVLLGTGGNTLLLSWMKSSTLSTSPRWVTLASASPGLWTDPSDPSGLSPCACPSVLLSSYCAMPLV